MGEDGSTQEYEQKALSSVKDSYPKTVVITSAQSYATPNSDFLDSLKEYEQTNSAHTIVLPMIGKNASEDLEGIDETFKDYDVEYGKRRLNRHIGIEQFHVRPYQIDPITGLQRFAQREQTKIFASPKQRLQPIPHSNRKHPKYLVTTGACTHPNYAMGSDVSAERRRLGDIARRDHVYGALVVEMPDDDVFYMRHVRSTEAGRFVDLGITYNGSETGKAKVEALVLGDYHVGRTDPVVREATHRMIARLQPERLFVHDFFDGHSVSHHVDKQYITQKLIQQLDVGHDSLEQELKQCYDELHVLSNISHGAEINLVLSNHHEFLNRYLDEGRFMKDAINARYGFKLASYMALKDYNDPLEAGIKMMGKLPKNIHFLRRDDDYKVRGYQLAAHGDKGVGFGYGSMATKEADWGKSISGHVHKGQILRNTYTVGTMLPLNMYYMRGQPSDWNHTHAALYDNGSVQLLSIFDGKYSLKDKK